MSSPIEDIKKRVDIVDLIGSYIRLSKAGANFKAVCPFHNEKTPSFYVSPAREIFHCFGCNAGGDVFRFVSMIEGVEFPEALEMLASRAGITLRREDPRASNERKRLLNLMDEATKFYQAELLKNKPALEYLKGRGVKDESIKEFRLGFAPDGWEGVLNYLGQSGYTSQEAEKVGLAILSQRSDARTKFYDRFRSRIMFPVSDPSGRVVGFSGRIFGKETNLPGRQAGEGKYINSPQTVLYDKSKILYLWDRAKNDVRKENACVLVEGQMDALMSHQAGVKNVVATSGTALSNGHLNLIKRLTGRLLLAFDTDEAGEMAARRGYELSLESGFDVNIIEVRGGKDPAETIKENADLWSSAVREAKPVVAFFLENIKKRFSGDLYSLRNEAKTAVFPYIARLPDSIDRAHWIQEASKVLELREEPLWEELKKFSKKGEVIPGKEPKRADVVSKTRRHLVEERLLGMIYWQKDQLLKEVSLGIKDAFSEENLKALEAITEGKEIPKELEGLLSKFSLEAELLYGEAPDIRAEFKSLVSELEQEAVKSKLEFLSEQIRKMEIAGEKNRLGEYLKEFQDASKKLNNLWQEARLKK